MDFSRPGFPVLHHLQEFAQTHVHWVSDAIQLSHPLSSPSPPALSLSHHQGLFQWVGSLHPASPPPESLPWPSSLHRDCFLHNTSGPLELVGTCFAHRRICAPLVSPAGLWASTSLSMFMFWRCLVPGRTLANLRVIDSFKELDGCTAVALWLWVRQERWATKETVFQVNQNIKNQAVRFFFFLITAEIYHIFFAS